MNKIQEENPYFHVVFKEANMFKQLIKSLKSLINETVFHCTENGIRIESMDDTHVSLTTVKLNANAFREYICQQPMKLGIDLIKLDDILRSVDSNSIVTIDKIKENDSILHIIIQNETQTINNQLSLEIINFEEYEIQTEDFNCIVTISSKELLNVTKTFLSSDDSERMCIKCNKHEITFYSLHQKDNKITFTKNSNNSKHSTLDIIHHSNVTILLSRDFLSKFVKSASLSSTVTLYLSNNFPLVMEYKGLGFLLKYYLAPMETESNA